jgi:UDP-MurNAc hydroxylase
MAAFELTYLGHACLLVRGGGRTILMDPWLEDPAYCNSWYHWPPLVLRARDVLPVDWVYCSHDHPDHFDRRTPAQLPREQQFLVPDFASGELLRKYRREGFRELRRLPFGEEVELAPDLRVVMLRSDLVWEDSAILVRSGGITLFNMNDCKLGDELLAEVGRRWRPDIAFVPFSGAIHFPTCYDYAPERRAELCRARRAKHLRAFVHRVRLLGARWAVPFAGNFALLHPEQLWMNDPEQNNFNTPDEAIELLRAELPQVEGLQLNPGDRWTPDGGIVRHAPPPDFAGRMAELRRLSAAEAPRLLRLRAAEAPARPTLAQDFRAYFERIARAHPTLPGRIASRILFVATGAGGGSWLQDWSPRGLSIEPAGDDSAWQMRIELPASILQQVLDDEICWDEVVISFRCRFAERPERFQQDFWAMLYNNSERFLAGYLADPAPKFA